MHLSGRDRIVASQRAKIDELEEELRQAREKLRESLAPPVPFPHEWGLTVSQSRLLGALYRASDVMTEHQVFRALGSTASDMRALVNVQISILRKKVAPLGITISNRYGFGYRLPKESIDIIKSSLEGKDGTTE